jgi:hypothetical protein
MSAKRQVWTFGEWFRAQHGPRPGGEMTDEEMLEAVAKGEECRRLYRERLDWDNRRTSALYAWQVPNSLKRGGVR